MLTVLPMLSAVFVGFSLYRVIVERVNPRHRRSTSSSGLPCGLADHELVGHQLASHRGLACYIAAELVNVDNDDDQPFIVGDGKMYGGYHNAPLDQDGSYCVWLGYIVTIDGVLSSFFSAIRLVPNSV